MASLPPSGFQHRVCCLTSLLDLFMPGEGIILFLSEIRRALLLRSITRQGLFVHADMTIGLKSIRNFYCFFVLNMDS